jgi:porin
LAVFAVVLLLAVASTAVAEPELPLPTHPGREETDPVKSRPKPAQPGREEFPTAHRTLSQLPKPGQPSRGLSPPGEEPPTEAESSEDEVPPGLTNFLPHTAKGITAEYIYTGEGFSNAHGGLNTNQATSYRGNLDLVMHFDTQAMGLWQGGRFLIYGQNTHGRTLSTNDVGDWQYFSNLDSTPRPEFTQVSEYWYQHNVADNAAWFKLGKQDANANFAFCDLGGDFVNSSFGLIPTVPLPTFPNPGLGLAGFWHLDEHLLLAGGVYNGAPQGGQFGFNTLGSNGYFSIVQLDVKTQWGAQEQLPQTIRLGAWHHSGDWEEIAAADGRTFNQNYGVYASIDQLLWKENGEAGDEQGFGVFAQYGWAPGDRNMVDEYYGGGLLYRGWLAGRDTDLVGLGFASVLFSHQQHAIDGATRETAYELFYKWYVNRYISVQPDTQYIVQPSGIHRDALVTGVRFEIVF